MMNPMNQIGGRGWDQNYYDNNYQQNECMYGCPANSHCEWGFCECNAGTSRFFKTFQLFVDAILYQEVRSVPVRLVSGPQLHPSTPDLRPIQGDNLFGDNLFGLKNLGKLYQK